MDNVIAAFPTQIASMMNVDGHQMSFDERPYLVPIYDMCEDHMPGPRDVVVMGGRQIEKSTTVALLLGAYGLMNANVRCCFATPTEKQLRVFSNDRFAKYMEDSPVAASFLNTRRNWQMFNRRFANNSSFYFRNVFEGPESARGITAEILALDEVQSLDSDTITVLERCQDHCRDHPLCRSMYFGTPLTRANPLYNRYRNSCQFTWFIRCPSCNRDNFPGLKIVGPEHYTCTYCGREIVPWKHGRWIPLNPGKVSERWGFHIPQMLCPSMKSRHIYKEIHKVEMTETKILNEILGQPSQGGPTLVTLEDVARVCTPSLPMMTVAQVRDLSRRVRLFAGLDYGSGASSGDTAYTVLVVGFWDRDHVFQVVFMHRFTGNEAELHALAQVVDDYLVAMGVETLIADEGFGETHNSILSNTFGWHPVTPESVHNDHALFRIRYTRQGPFMTYSPDRLCYYGDRSQIVLNTTSFIKDGKLRLPKLETIQEYMDDLTALHREFDYTMRSVNYVHSVPDDTFQALSILLAGASLYHPAHRYAVKYKKSR